MILVALIFLAQCILWLRAYVTEQIHIHTVDIQNFCKMENLTNFTYLTQDKYILKWAQFF